MTRLIALLASATFGLSAAGVAAADFPQKGEATYDTYFVSENKATIDGQVGTGEIDILTGINRNVKGEGPFNGEIVVSPVAGDGMVFLQTWRQSPIHAIRLKPNGAPPERLWVSEKPGPQEPSPVYYRGLLYVLMDNGVLACFEGKTGKELYRVRLGGACNSSPIAAGEGGRRAD